MLSCRGLTRSSEWRQGVDLVDVVDPATRSRMMAGIRGKHTRPEVSLRRALHARGLRFRLHDRKLPGAPDIVLPGRKTVILVQGCFWHRHQGCRYASTPTTRPEFWSRKFGETIARDERNVALLQGQGWRVALVWECALRRTGAQAIADRIIEWLARKDGELTVE
ncbi:MAG TPA: DNA mismatch endonuclease Vsr [Sphingomicrobium sp.]|nr:DNA mismatch endonuclease Vsr [Sphingomicrobium sp.]